MANLKNKHFLIIDLAIKSHFKCTPCKLSPYHQCVTSTCSFWLRAMMLPPCFELILQSENWSKHSDERTFGWFLPKRIKWARGLRFRPIMQIQKMFFQRKRFFFLLLLLRFSLLLDLKRHSDKTFHCCFPFTVFYISTRQSYW